MAGRAAPGTGAPDAAAPEAEIRDSAAQEGTPCSSILVGGCIPMGAGSRRDRDLDGRELPPCRGSLRPRVAPGVGETPPEGNRLPPRGRSDDGGGGAAVMGFSMKPGCRQRAGGGTGLPQPAASACPGPFLQATFRRLPAGSLQAPCRLPSGGSLQTACSAALISSQRPLIPRLAGDRGEYSVTGIPAIMASVTASSKGTRPRTLIPLSRQCASI